MKRVKRLSEMLDLLQELDYVPGVSMAVPDFNYTVGKRRNFDPTDHDDDWPYDEPAGGGPQNAQGDGQPGVGRGGVGWGGRPDRSGGVREPSAAYDRTWDQNDTHMEGADWDELQRHGGDRRNLWRDSPEGKLTRDRMEDDELGEAMGSPTQTGPVAPMDGPQHNVLHFSGSIDDMIPKDMNTGPATQWGGPGMIPGQSRGWAATPTKGDSDATVWRIPRDREDEDMKLSEFFDPEPVRAEPLTNPSQDYLNDQTDEELETQADRIWGDDHGEEGGDGSESGGDEDPQSFVGRYGGETIMLVPNVGKGTEFIMSPDKHAAARGTYGMHADGAERVSSDLLDKRSAWDVLQHVIAALAARSEKSGNEENPGSEE